jgi:TPR repeat protein
MPEPYEERTGRRQGGPFADQTKSPSDRDGRAVTFEAGAKQPGYVPPLSDHLSLNQAHLGSTSAASQPSAEDYLQMGIDKHEKSQGDEELSESAHYFRKAAEGGSAAGCVFYGLALRHGWGVQRDEKQAFGWLEMGCATVMQKPSTDIVDLDRRQSLMPMGTQNKLSVSSRSVTTRMVQYDWACMRISRRKWSWQSMRLATASSTLGAFLVPNEISQTIKWLQCIIVWVQSRETEIIKSVSISRDGISAALDRP